MTPKRKNYKIELLMNQLTASFLVYKVRQLLVSSCYIYLEPSKEREKHNLNEILMSLWAL